MKVCHILWGLKSGGIETMLVNIANEQVEAGAEVGIIIINDIVESSLMKKFDDRIKVYNLGRKVGAKGLGFIFRLNNLLGKLNPDAVHLHSSKIYRLILRRKLRRVVSVTLHDLPCGSVSHGMLMRCLPFLEMGYSGNVTGIDCIPRVFAISEAVHNMLQEKYGVDSMVVKNGIRTAAFISRKYSVPHAPLRVIQVSRLVHEKKGQDLLIRAAAKLYGQIDVSFIGDGSSMDYLRQLTRDLGVEEYVHFLGKWTQDNIASHLCDYDLFVQASRWEGFGLTVAEAMAANLPVLVSEGQGPAEVTCGDKYGWIFENGNSDALAEAIIYIVEHYDEALAKVKEAYNYVVANYDVSVTARKYLDSYNSF